MKWNQLTDENQLQILIKNSAIKPQLIFKHSTRCGISNMVLRRFEADWEIPENEIDLYFLDLLSHRNISNQITNELQVEHESPQVIIVNKEKVAHHTSHQGISADELKLLVANF